jgi:signal transduction histidine kinase
MLAAMNDTEALPPYALQSHSGNLRQRLFTPLNIAAYITWLAVAIGVVDTTKLRAGLITEWIGSLALVAMLALFIRCAARAPHSTLHGLPLMVMLEGALVVFAEWMLHGGQTAVLLIIIAAQLVLTLPIRATVVYLAVANAAIAWLWIDRSGQIGGTLQWMVPVIGFQAFSALTGHFADSSERARAHLALVNTELMATRRLLEESARAGERLKLSRELHDVAGHSLTALKLNLARLMREPALAEREELRVSSALADELLGQIRQVVGALRAHDGLDLRAALDALAHPLPGTRVELAIDDGLRVDDIDQAETLLRCAQEAITNAVRHGRATQITVGLHHRDDALELQIENNGIAPTTLTPGNGLTGMRERIVAIGGTLDVAPTPPRGLVVTARIPLSPDRERIA